MLSIKQRRCAEDIKVDWIDWMVITDGEINNGLTLNTCIGRGGSWAALLLGFCCSAGLLVCCSDRAASSSSLTPHWFTHPWNSHWGRRPPQLLHYSSLTSAMRSALWHHFCWWLSAALNFLKKVVVPRKRRFKRDKFGLKWVDAAAKYTNPFELSFSHKIWMNCWLKLKEIPVLKCEGRQWSTFNHQVTLTRF